MHERTNIQLSATDRNELESVVEGHGLSDNGARGSCLPCLRRHRHMTQSIGKSVAEEARTLAEGMNDAHSKILMLGTAEIYET
jgi:hypothetical protein